MLYLTAFYSPGIFNWVMSLDLCKKKMFFFSKMSSEWLEFYESFVHAFAHIRFWKLYLISFDFHQSDDQQIISEFFYTD